MRFNSALIFHPEDVDFFRSFAATWFGKVVAFAVMAIAFLYLNHWDYRAWDLKMLGVAFLVASIPKFRSQILLAGAVLCGMWEIPGGFGSGFLKFNILPVVAVFGGALLLLMAAKNIGRKYIFAYPVVSLLLLLTTLIGLSQLPFLSSSTKHYLWIAAGMLSFAKWFLAYAIHNVTSRRPKPGTLIENLSMLHPFWGSSQTPFGKGWSYVKKHEARDDGRLAKTQIRAVHLILTVVLIKIMGSYYWELTHNIHDPFTYMMEMARGENPSRLMSAISLPTQFFSSLFGLFIWGNSVIAIARFAGYDLQQNTINPLFSRSIADFWNRWYFYFKELLVEFFFMPTFQRTAWMPERLRIFTATLMAAGFGNYVFHIYRDFWIIGDVGIIAYLKGTGIYAIYSLVLGVGIGISQALNPFTAADGNERTFKPHVCLGIILFFCTVGLLGEEEPATVFAQHSQVGILEYLKFYAYICHLI